MRLLYLLATAVTLAPASAATTSTEKTTSTSTHKTSSTSPHATSTTLHTSTTSKHFTTTTTKTSTTQKSTTSTHSTVTTKTTTQSTTSKPTTTSTTTIKSTSTTISSAAASGTPVKNSGKRMLAFNDPALTAPFSLSNQTSKVSAAYNWASDPYYPGTWTAGSYNPALTFVPMLWSAADDLTSIWAGNVANARAKYGADAVLAFNEPDGCCWSCGNSCMNVSAAVAAFQQWVQPLAGQVRLGAPAVTNGVGEGIGISYLQYFMGNCTGCTVDFIPLHWYGSVLDPNSFMQYVTSFYAQFGREVWVTEFATSSGTADQIVAFLNVVLPWLDAQPWIGRYAYFMDSNQGAPYLLNANGTMNEIGVTFNSG